MFHYGTNACMSKLQVLMFVFPSKFNSILNRYPETTMHASIINVFNKSKSFQRVVPFPFQNARQNGSTHVIRCSCRMLKNTFCCKSLSAQQMPKFAALHRNLLAGWLLFHMPLEKVHLYWGVTFGGERFAKFRILLPSMTFEQREGIFFVQNMTRDFSFTVSSCNRSSTNCRTQCIMGKAVRYISYYVKLKAELDLLENPVVVQLSKFGVGRFLLLQSR